MHSIQWQKIWTKETFINWCILNIHISLAENEKKKKQIRIKIDNILRFWVQLKAAGVAHFINSSWKNTN